MKYNILRKLLYLFQDLKKNKNNNNNINDWEWKPAKKTNEVEISTKPVETCFWCTYNKFNKCCLKSPYFNICSCAYFKYNSKLVTEYENLKSIYIDKLKSSINK